MAKVTKCSQFAKEKERSTPFVGQPPGYPRFSICQVGGGLAPPHQTYHARR